MRTILPLMGRLARRVSFLSLVLLALTADTSAQLPAKSFTPVQGSQLSEKLDNALNQARAARQSRFWTAYSFDVRPGIGIDVQYVGDDGSSFTISGTGANFGDPRNETRSLGVFVLKDADTGNITRVDVFNLSREHDYSGFPVYWAGHIANEESLNYLKTAVLSTDRAAVSDGSVLAIAAHDDRRVATTLIEVAKGSKSVNARRSAINWMGSIEEATESVSFLTGFARDTSQEVELRQQAIRSLGRFRDPVLLPELTKMYTSTGETGLKQAVLGSVAANKDTRGAASFLLEIATSSNDTEQKRQALVQLSRIATRRDRGYVENTDADIAVQREAVRAISRRDKQESIPVLINIAKNNPKDEVRREAMLSLGRIGDDRAIAFFRDTLLK